MRAAATGLPVVLWELDEAGTFRLSTGAGLERLGLRDGEAVGQSAFELYPQAAEPIRRALAGEVVQFVSYGTSTAGDWSFESIVMFDAARGHGVIGVSIDVTERVRAEAAMRDRARQNALVAELATDALRGTDVDAVLAAGARTAAAGVSADLSEVLEHDERTSELVLRAGDGWEPGLVGTARDPEAQRTLAGFALRSSAPVVVADVGVEERFVPRARVVAAGVRSEACVAIPGESGPIGLLVVHSRRVNAFAAEDVTFLQAVANVLAATLGRRRAEERTHVAEARFSELVDALPDVVVVIDAEGRVVSLNRAFETVTGHGRSDWLGRHFTPLVHPDDLLRIERALIAVRRENASRLFEVRVRVADGSYRTFELQLSPLRDGRRIAGAVGVGRDVSERKRLENQLRHAQRLESLGRLAGGVAHDFNNLLLVMSGHAALLVDHVRADEQATEHVESIARSAERAADLTKRLLAFSRKQILETRVFPVDEVVEETSKMLCRMIGEDVDVETTLAAPEAHVHADPTAIEQVLVNLAVNSRDAMPTGGRFSIRTSLVELDPREAAREDVQPGTYVAIAASDTGCGMDETVLARIFEPFFTTKEPGRGTGLGLAMVYGIVRQSGGVVRVRSQVGKGTTFTIELPLARAPATDWSPEPAPTGGAPGGNERVLVVEDDADVREFVVEVLRESGYHVTPAVDGVHALEIADRAHFDVVVSDVVMPRIGGLEFVPRMRRAQPNARVLLMSGYAADSEHVEEHLAGADGFLPKPFTPSALALKLRSVLDSPRHQPV